MLNQALADLLQQRAKVILNRSVIVADATGLLIADGSERGQVVPDALRACQEGRPVRSELHNEPVMWVPFTYDQQTIGACGVIEAFGQVTPEAVALLQGLAEVITQEHFVSLHLQPSDELRHNLLREVLTNSRLGAEEAYRQADILQLDLRTPNAIMTVYGVEQPGGWIWPATEIEPGRWALLVPLAGPQPTTRNSQRYLRAKAAELLEQLQKAGHPDVVIGIGHYYPELGGLRKSYQDARLAAEVGTKVWGAGSSYHIKDVGMYVTLANVSQQRKAELAHDILAPLLADEQLYKSVSMFLSHRLNLTEAAEALHIHRNTLIYRLEKTHQLIGLDPRRFDDALQIKLGLLFYRGEPLTTPTPLAR